VVNEKKHVNPNKMEFYICDKNRNDRHIENYAQIQENFAVVL
jgi:hypothetical protein